MIRFLLAILYLAIGVVPNFAVYGEAPVDST